jgi:hypothetical protein
MDVRVLQIFLFEGQAHGMVIQAMQFVIVPSGDFSRRETQTRAGLAETEIQQALPKAQRRQTRLEVSDVVPVVKVQPALA